MVGVFGVLTNGTGGLLQNNLSDAFAVPQYVTQNAQILSKQIAVCMVAVAEPGMQSSPSGGAVSSQARALNVTSKKSKKAKPCHSKKKTPPETPVSGGGQIGADCCAKMAHPHAGSMSRCIYQMCWAIHYGNPALIQACENNAWRLFRNVPCSVRPWHYKTVWTLPYPDPLIGHDTPGGAGGPGPFHGGDDDGEG